MSLSAKYQMESVDLQAASLANQFLSIYPSLAITGGEVFFVLPHSLTPLNILLCRTSLNIFLGSFEKGEEKRHKMCFWLLNLNSYSSTCSRPPHIQHYIRSNNP